MRCLVMFITAVSLKFLFKLKWPKNKSVYDLLYRYLLVVSQLGSLILSTILYWYGSSPTWALNIGSFDRKLRSFFTSSASLRFLFSKSPARFFSRRRGVYATVAILILTLATIWLPGTGFKQMFFIFHRVVLLYSQIILRENITKYQAHLSAIV